jgi:hypothetical protein
MDISFNINGLQEGKKYVIEFAVNGEGTTNVVQPSALPLAHAPEGPKKEDDGMPSLEDLERDNSLEMPSLDPVDMPKEKRKIKVERSWEGNLKE